MENLILSFNVVMPLFLCIAVGYLLRLLHMYTEETLRQVNRLCFKVFLPFYLFNSIYTTDLKEAFDGRLILFSLAGVLLFFTALMLLIPRIEKDSARRGVLVQGIFRSNFVLFGLPVATSLCGEDQVGVTSLLIAVIVPTFNMLAVVALETFRGGRPSVRKILKGVVTNPLIIASLLGILAYFLHVSLPYAVSKAVTDLSRVATPLSLVVLGGSFTFRSIRGYRKQLILGVIGKLVVAPLIMVPAAAALGYRGAALASVMIMYGSPTAVSSYTMALQMDGDGDLAAGMVVFSSALAIFTIFIWIFLLKQLGWI